MTARIDRVWPDAASDLSDAELTRSMGAGLRLNFVSSVDGAATHAGRSGGLSGAGDKRHFELLRRVCDVVLVGAGTVRTEGYGPMRVSEASAQWRVARGMPAHPVFAMVSGRLDLDPDSPIFTEAPVRPVVITTTGAHGIGRFDGVADVVAVGQGPGVDVAAMVTELHKRGLTHVLCEGGPTLFGALLAADAVDELSLTVTSSLEGGDAPRIAVGSTATRSMTLTQILKSGDDLVLRYARPHGDGA